jgi:hypothetical protein
MRRHREPGLYVALDLWLPGLVTHHAVQSEGRHLPERSEAAADARPPRLALAVGATDTERRLMEQWLRSEGLDAATPAGMLVVADDTLAARLQRHGDVLVTPVRVVWLPRERDGGPGAAPAPRRPASPRGAAGAGRAPPPRPGEAG